MQPVNLRPLHLLLLAVLFLALAGSCGKSGKDPAPVTSAVVGNWKISAITINPGIGLGDTTITDLFAFLRQDVSTCIVDVTLMFSQNGTLTADNPASCQAGGIAQATGFEENAKWVLSGTRMTVTDSDGTVTAYETTVTGTTMTLIWYADLPDTTGKVVRYTSTITLRRV